MRHTLQLDTQNRAVSPVIGVILMVAITVILAAVIGAFVLEIGDQQETAPNTSYETEERTVFVQRENDPGNMTQVVITHVGGDSNAVSQTDVAINGNRSAFASSDGKTIALHEGGVRGTKPLTRPVPDIGRTAGSNDNVEFSSGDVWAPLGYGTADGGQGPGFPADDNVETGCDYLWEAIRIDPNSGQLVWETMFNKWGNNAPEDCFTNGQGYDSTDGMANPIMAGDTISIVWTASSGGKSQTVFTYTAQSDSRT